MDQALYGLPLAFSVAVGEEFRPPPTISLRLDLGIKIEERFQTGAKLLLDLFLTAFKHVHGDVGLASVR